MATRSCVVFVTSPVGKKGIKIADQIVKSRLAACVNVIPIVQSIYWWKGKRVNGKESLLVIKTQKKLVRKLIAHVRKIHPYGVPEIISLPIDQGHWPYLAWVLRETGA